MYDRTFGIRTTAAHLRDLTDRVSVFDQDSDGRAIVGTLYQQGPGKYKGYLNNGKFSDVGEAYRAQITKVIAQADDLFNGPAQTAVWNPAGPYDWFL
jgi:hypothetical protein